MKLVIAMMRDRKPPGKGEVLNAPLETRVHYALQVIDAGEGGDAHVAEACAFLKAHLQDIEDPDLAEQAHQAVNAAEPDTTHLPSDIEGA